MEEKSESPGQDEDDLSELLDEARLRRDGRVERMGGRVSLIMGIPILLLFAWAGAFLVKYNHDNPPAAQPARQTTGASRPGDHGGTAQHDVFTEERDRALKSITSGSGDQPGSLIGKEDVNFAVWLLNFMQDPDSNENKKD